MKQEFNNLNGNYSKQYILDEYAAGRIPELLKVVFCTVCQVPVGSELLAPLSYADFVKFLAKGVIQEMNGQFTRLTDHGGLEICESCQKEMEEIDKKEGTTLCPPKRYSPF